MSRRIVVTEFVTLDGVMEDPGGAEGTPFGGWAFKFDRGDAGNAFKQEEQMAADALLLGRKTYAGFAAAWPSRTDDYGYAEKMNSMPKYVVSSTLTDPAWTNTSVIGVDDVENLEGNILLHGSRQLAQALLARKLVDEVRLVLYPTALGDGKKLFDVPGDYSLVSAEPSAQVVLLVYERA
jgi:dihydrofolate reductase